MNFPFLIQIFSQKTVQTNGSGASQEEINEKEPNPNEDVLIKYVRVVANLAISEDVGEKLAKREDVLDILLKILGKIIFKFMKIFKVIGPIKSILIQII